MARALRTAFVALLLAALSLHGFAAVWGGCAHTGAFHEVSSLQEPAGSAPAEAGMSEAAPEHGGLPMSACAAVPAADAQVLVHGGPPGLASSHQVLAIVFVTGGPDRPPRSARA